jgi:hypothetical protein
MSDSQLAKTSNDVTKWDRPMDLTHLTVNQLRFMGQAMADSGMFPDIQKDSAKAMVKIMAGQEIGVTPFQAVTGINIIQGKAAMGANLMAAKLKGHPKYDYRTKLSSESCTIVIRQLSHNRNDYEDIGEFTFSMEDAKRQGLAGKDNWRKFPQNMLFARAISNAVRIYAPDVFNGTLVYEPDELGATTDDNGTVVAPNTELDEAIAKINTAKDEDELTDIVAALSPELQKNVVEAAQAKFTELSAA